MQNYNLIRETIDISNESGPVEEPVSLDEIKSYLRVNGFIDDNDSTDADNFEDDDELIEEMIKTARESLEESLGVSIVTHDWKAVGVTNEAGMVQLKYGPVTEITSAKNYSGDEYDADKIKHNGDFLSSPTDCSMEIEYTAGPFAPSPIITEIKRMVAYLYENRGDVDGLEGYKISNSVKKYSRIPWLA